MAELALISALIHLGGQKAMCDSDCRDHLQYTHTHIQTMHKHSHAHLHTESTNIHSMGTCVNTLQNVSTHTLVARYKQWCTKKKKKKKPTHPLAHHQAEKSVICVITECSQIVISAVAPTDLETSPDLFISPEKRPCSVWLKTFLPWPKINYFKSAAKHNLDLSLTKRCFLIAVKLFFFTGWTELCSYRNMLLCVPPVLSSSNQLCLFSSYLLFLLPTRFFSSSGAKQNAGGGCHRQIKSLLLMQCSDIEKIEAAQAPAQFREKASNF